MRSLRHLAAVCFSVSLSLPTWAAEVPAPDHAASVDELLEKGEALGKAEEQGPSRELVTLYGQVLDRLGPEGDPAKLVRAWRGLSAAHFHLGQIKDALHAAERTLDYARRVNDEQAIADALAEMGILQGENGDPPTAMETLTRAAELQRKLGNPLKEADVLTGLAYWSERHLANPRRALELYQVVFERREAAGKPVLAAQTLNYMASVHYGLGEVDKAIELYDRCLEVFRRAAAAYWEAVTLHNIGNLRASVGQTDAALEAFRAAVELERAVDNKRMRADTLRVMSDVHVLRGDIGEALEALERALVLYEELGDRFGEATTQRVLGQRHAALGDFGAAVPRLERALALAREQARHDLHVSVLLELAHVREAQGQRSEAHAMLESMLPLARAAGPSSLASVLRRLGELRRFLGRREEARATLLEALQLMTRNWVAEEASTRGILGRLEMDEGHMPKAVEEWQKALELYRQAGHRWGEADALYRLALAKVRQGAGDEALAHVRDALEIIESVRGAVHGSNLRIRYLATKQDVYELYVDVLVDQHRRLPDGGYAARALEAAERARARGLLDSLSAAQVDAFRGVPPELLKRQADTRATLNGLEHHRMRLLREEKREAAAKASEEIAALVSRLQDLNRQIAAADPRGADLRQTTPVALADIQRLVLDDDTVLLEYALGGERSHLFVVTREEVEVFSIPPRADIEKAARRVHELMNARGQRRAFETASKHRVRIAAADRDLPAEVAALSRMILPDAIRPRLRHRLLIVPHGALHYVPFAALPAPAAPADDPILARHEVVMAPSASYLAERRRQPPREGAVAARLAVFADPVFEPDDPRVVARAGRGKATVARTQPVELAHRAAEPFTSGGIPRLIHSRKEAQAILSLVPRAQRRAALDFEATRAAATSPDLARYGIVHFATHGFVHSDHPELSGLVLSLVDEKGEPQDGFLRLHDIYNLQLDADLVVLNACETALGAELRGEGLNGLTRGFLHAGARRVLASLWNTSDSASAELITRFYGGLLERGQSPAEALRAAQLATRSRLRAPYYWAPLVLQGDWR